MPATPVRIGFILNEYRRSVGQDEDVKAKFGSLARQSEDPIPTYFTVEADGDTIAAERLELLSATRRRFRAVITDTENMIDVDMTEAAPVVRYVDPRRSADMTAIVAEVSIDLGRNTTTAILWG